MQREKEYDTIMVSSYMVGDAERPSNTIVYIYSVCLRLFFASPFLKGRDTRHEGFFWFK